MKTISVFHIDRRILDRVFSLLGRRHDCFLEKLTETMIGYEIVVSFNSFCAEVEFGKELNQIDIAPDSFFQFLWSCFCVIFE